MATDLLFQAGLLAGLGPQAKWLRPQPEQTTTAIEQPQKSCISAGNDLILSVVAPGSRGLRVSQKIAGTQRWLQTYHDRNTDANSLTERWITEFFLAQSVSSEKAPWPKVLEFAQALTAEDKARQYHQILGPRARLLSYAKRVDSTPGGWVTWQLDKHYLPALALADCNVSWAWPLAATHLKALFGRSVSKYCRPWSLAVELSGAQPRFRLGTTVWARQTESAEKHRRLAATVAHMGGDSRFAEGLYKLIAASRFANDSASDSASDLASHTTKWTNRIGRAVEIEFYNNQVSAMEFFLCVSTS